jgi:ABC-type transporter Mla subunit MlaD
MSEQPAKPDSATGDSEGGLLGRFARGAARAARRLQHEAEERRPRAERAAHDAAERVRKAADDAKPEVERLARNAKAAADAALPHIERAAKEAVDYTREHQDEIKGAAGKAGRVAARGVTPAPLRPAIDAFEEELTGPGAEGAEGTEKGAGGTGTAADPHEASDKS